LIVSKLAWEELWLSGEVEVDEIYLGGSRKGKHGFEAVGRIPVFGLLERGGKVHVVIIPNTKKNILIPIIRQTIEPDSIVYTDGFFSYEALDVCEFRNNFNNHLEKFVEARNHINGIENFWNQAKCHLSTFNLIPRENIHLFIKECEWRLNYRPTAKLFKTLLGWAKVDIM
jgi:transposase